MGRQFKCREGEFKEDFIQILVRQNRHEPWQYFLIDKNCSLQQMRFVCPGYDGNVE